MKRTIMAALAAFLLVALAHPAEAKKHRHPHRTHASHSAVQNCDNNGRCTKFSSVQGGVAFKAHRDFAASYDAGEIVSHPAGCPWHAFCGCGVSVWAFGHSIRDLWPARAYYRFPRDRAASGNVAIFGAHHVAGIIQAYSDGTALLYDPNSGGHQTRIHRRSIAGATIVNPHGSRTAMR